MAVALVINGVPDIQLSMTDGLEVLKVLLSDRQSVGCAVTPTERIGFGIQYRIEHPSHEVETVFLTYFHDSADDPEAI
ncbi:MAG TPA: hypothetical protein VMF03_14980 [Steroidobacteraceae bacterium]|nr:hypothetical protein [Steroidobacteraceae bacterium]